MNQKFSTLMAGLLLAGAWTTADAELLKVTPKAGGTYLIGTAVNENTGKMTNMLKGTTLASENGEGSAAVTSMDEAFFFEEAKTSDGKACFYLKPTTGTYKGQYIILSTEQSKSYTDYSSEKTNAIKFVLSGKKLLVAENVNHGGATFHKDDEVVLAGNARFTVKYDGTDGSELAFAVANDDVKVLNSTTSLALQTSFSADEYYVVASEDKKLLKDDGTGALSAVDLTNVAEVDNFLWKITKGETADKKTTYTFENKASEKKVIVSSIDKFIVDGSAASFQLSLNGETGQTLGENFAVNATAATFGIYKSPVIKEYASVLNDLLHEGFNMTIKQTSADKSTIKGVGAFEGKLKAVSTTANATRFQLMSGEDYVVLNKSDLWSGTNTGSHARNAKFAVISKEELDKDTKNEKYFSWFEFNHHAGNTKGELTTVAVCKKDADDAFFGNLFIQSLNGQICLTSSDALVDDNEAWPYIVLKADNIVDPADFLQKGKFAVITLLDEENGNQIFAANDCEGCALVDAVENELEAQWAITIKDGNYVLTNRENTDATKTVALNSLRENDKDDDNIYVVDGKTYKVEFVSGEGEFYKDLLDVDNQSFRMAHHSGVYKQNAWFTTDEDGYVLIDIDADKAIEIKATNGGVAKKDTAEVTVEIGYIKADGNYDKTTSTLKVPVYKFYADDQAFNLNSTSKKYQFDGTDAYVFAIRKDGDYWNLRPVTVTGNVASMDCAKAYASTSDATAGYLKKANGLYTETSNDWFVVEENNRPVYRRLGATIENDGFTGKVDTAKFFRTNDVTSYYLYENTMNRNTQGGKVSLNFLGESHLDDLPENAALPILVDTAYVRNNTTKPLYMLAVRDAEWVEGTPFTPCDKEKDHGFDENGNALTAEQCPHATPAVPGYRKAHYLVVLSDSINAKVNKDVKYKDFTRLAFVPATHFENDTLVIENSKFTNDKKLAKNDTIALADAKDKAVEGVATFAFRLVNPADAEEGGEGDFYIETMAKEEGKLVTRYVHVLNSVPVLVDKIEQAAPFNIESAEHEAATSNEGIEAEGVKVVAAEGAVIVKGAEGKNVVITNVLGQTIANTVVTSSEATIAAPQGVVVVAVEGEAAVKALVK